jgi:dephospho-CoA kinase
MSSSAERSHGPSSSAAARKPVVGLCGGIGAGKSTVAKLLAERGAVVIDSDALNSDVLTEPEVAETIHKWFGDKILSKEGTIDRRQIADIIFDDAEQRQRLQEYLYPRIAERRKALMAQYQTDPHVLAIVLDSPLLYEARLDQECDRVIFVECDQRRRCQRLAASRGWSAEEVARREKAQKALDFKRARADYTIQNKSSMDALRRQVDEVLSQIIISIKES